MGKTRFRVRLRSFRATDLPGKDLDPFVKVNFDSFKKFQTNAVSGNNPKWDTDTQFLYETQYADKLHRKRVVLIVYSHNTIVAHDLIGQVDVDLQTLACGPSHQDLQLWNESKPAGRLQFTVEMEEVGSVTLFVKDMLISGVPTAEAGEQPTAHVQVSASNWGEHKAGKAAAKKERVDIKTAPKSGTDIEFSNFEQLRFMATLKELWTDAIEISVFADKKSGKSALIGTAQLPYERYHSFKDLAIVQFKEPLVLSAEYRQLKGADAKGDANAITAQGSFYFKGFPTHVQMVGGVHTENGVADGKPLAKGVQMPPNVDSSAPPGHEDDDDHNQLSGEHHALSVSSARGDDSKAAPDGKSPGGAQRSIAERSPGGAARLAAPAASAGDRSPGLASRSLNRDRSASGSSNPAHARAPSSGADLPVLGAAAATAAAGAVAPASVPVIHRSPSPAPGPAAAPASNPVPHHAPAPVPVPAAATAVHMAYTPIVAPNHAFAKGVAGWCFACGKTADYVDSQTKMAICGRECKVVWLAHVAKLAPAAQDGASAKPAAAAGAVAASASVGAAGATPAAVALPPGWEQKIDPASGRVFYQNNITRTTQWHRPDPVAAPAAVTAAVTAAAAHVAATVAVPAAAPVPKGSPVPTPPSRAGGGGGGSGVPTPGNGWNCAACTFLNAEIAVACVQCRTPSPHVKAAAAPAPAPAPAPPKPAAADPPGSWACSACTLTNAPMALMCSACRAPKPLDKAAPNPARTPSPAPTPVPAAAPKPAGGWSCNACTMINKAGAAKCDACNTPNPSAKATAVAGAQSGKPAQVAAAAAGGAAKPKALTEPLPPGWEASWDYAHGRVYYKNHVTKKTQWDKPTLPAAATLAHPPAPAPGAAAGGAQQVNAASNPAVLANLPPEVRAMVAAGASVTVYQPNHPHAQALVGSHPAVAQAMAAPGPVQIYRTPDGRYVDAQGRQVQLLG